VCSSDLFAAKVREGVSKRVAPARVVQVAEGRALNLSRARALANALVLDGVPLADRAELIPDIAATLEAGRTADEVRAILADAVQAGDGVGDIRRKLFP
jgi:hypothetical protein